ncbi:hypothetical protein TNCT_435251 [Trichonephila clavata]|uniref:Uncharacterized protein n=1 Tax=Trichonephila clavata TaxID=2740835 RepID=A0A8X6G0X5_TRICU|nr:hypothetical protein TNCT_435251 [Trichonephila clavata]
MVGIRDYIPDYEYFNYALPAIVFFIILTTSSLAVVQLFLFGEYDLTLFFVFTFIVFGGMVYMYLSKIGRLLSLIVICGGFYTYKITNLEVHFPLRELKQMPLSTIEKYFPY